MTSKLTREQLHERARENVKALKMASRQTAFESAREEILADLQLAELALAAMDSEPVAYSLIFRNMDGALNNYINTNTTFSTREKAEAYGKGGSYETRSDGRLEWVPNTALDPVVVPLYRHAQPATVTERDPIAWLNDAYLARGVVDGEAGSEDAGPGYIPVYREAGPQPAPVVSDDLLSMAAAAIEDLLEHTDPNTSYYSGVWADVPGKLRAAMLQAGNCRENANSSTNNCREIPETSTNRSREHFISLCNEFWNWSEMDEVCAEDRGYELRMEWDGKVFKHPVTQALWRMYQATPQEVK